MPCIPDSFNTAFKVLEFLRSLPLGPQQMGHAKDCAYKAKREQKLDTYRKITGGIIQTGGCYLQ